MIEGHGRGEPMCGRVAVKKGLAGLVLEHLGAQGITDDWLVPNPNLSPTNLIPVVRLINGKRVATSYIWGFLPPNAPSRGFISEYFTFNARDDKLATGRLYAKPFRTQRCLIPVSAWFEWPKPPGAKKGTPCTIVPTGVDMFVFAGLWGMWTDPETGLEHGTATVITTSPNALIADLPHHRMPAILGPSEWETWLATSTPQAELQALLGPAAPGLMDVTVAGPHEFRL